jgi:hypothetical protein
MENTKGDKALSQEIKILLEFLKYPLTSAQEVFNRFGALPGAITSGIAPRRFCYIEGKRQDRVLLVAHADTFWSRKGVPKTKEHHLVLREEGVITTGSPGYGIGADDRAGCALLWLLKDLGHSLLITDGEELGLLGSKCLAEDESNASLFLHINETHQFAIEFDLDGAGVYKCYGVGTPVFKEYITQASGFKLIETQGRSDIVVLCQTIPGCNLSIGYENAHCVNERLDLKSWQLTLATCQKWLSQPNLPGFILND